MSVIISLFLQFLIFSDSYSGSSDCKRLCENDYEKCRQPLIELTRSYQSSKEGHFVELFNVYLQKNKILNKDEAIKISNNNIYITKECDAFSNDPCIQKQQIALLKRCLKILEKCRVKCQK